MPKISPCRAHREEIVASLSRGELAGSVAARLGLSHRALGAYVRRHLGGIRKLAPHGARWIEVDQDDLRARLAAGQTQVQIAGDLDVSLTTIERRCAELGLETSRTGPRAGQDHPEWLDGRHLDKHGYVEIYVPMHPFCRKSGKVFEHRLLLEVKLGRYLLATEVAHHLDDHPRHNWPENLGLFASNGDHLRHELAGKWGQSRRWLIPNAYRSPEKLPRCPDESETLAGCSSETRLRLARHIEIHRPTIEHRRLSRRSLRELGAWSAPFQEPTMG